MRQSNGGHFHMETKAAASALQKRLKIGIIKASLKYCNVGSDTEQQIYLKLIPAIDEKEICQSSLGQPASYYEGNLG